MTKIYDYKLQKKSCCVTATKTYDQNAPERLTHFLRIIAGIMQTVALTKKNMINLRFNDVLSLEQFVSLMQNATLKLNYVARI